MISTLYGGWSRRGLGEDGGWEAWQICLNVQKSILAIIPSNFLFDNGKKSVFLADLTFQAVFPSLLALVYGKRQDNVTAFTPYPPP